MLYPFLPSLRMYFRALPYSLGCTFTIYFSLMILNMHHVHDCIFESEKGAGGIHCTSPPGPHQSQVGLYRVLNTLELCSSEKKQKIQKGVKGQEEKVWFI